MLELELPLPPSLNHQYLRRRDRVALTSEARAYRDEATWLVRAAHPDSLPPGARLHVTVRFWFGDHRRRDLDNPLKLLLDALAAGLGVDDSQIDELHIYRHHDTASPRVVVRVLWDALPWHCAWCERPPVEAATSGVCGLHLAQLQREIARRRA